MTITLRNEISLLDPFLQRKPGVLPQAQARKNECIWFGAIAVQLKLAVYKMCWILWTSCRPRKTVGLKPQTMLSCYISNLFTSDFCTVPEPPACCIKALIKCDKKLRRQLWSCSQTKGLRLWNYALTFIRKHSSVAKG